MKAIHGVPQPFWQIHGLSETPPVACDFKIGDRVIFTNDAGGKFDEIVVGFAKDDSFYGRFIHIIRYGSNGDGCAWWFPNRPDELTLKTIVM